MKFTLKYGLITFLTSSLDGFRREPIGTNKLSNIMIYRKVMGLYVSEIIKSEQRESNSLNPKLHR